MREMMCDVIIGGMFGRRCEGGDIINIMAQFCPELKSESRIQFLCAIYSSANSLIQVPARRSGWVEWEGGSGRIRKDSRYIRGS